MSLQSDIETAVAAILAARDLIVADAALLDGIVNGPATGGTSTVITGAGTVKTAARAIAELLALYGALPDGSAAAPAVAFAADTNTGWYRVGNDQLGLVVGGTLILTITSAGIVMASGKRISTLTDPTSAQDAATQAWVQAQIAAAVIAAGAGDMVGPASSVAGRLVAFSNTGGKLAREATAADVYTLIGDYPRRSGAASWLAGEEGIALDFLTRTAAINDYSDTLSDSGRPQDLLTVTRAGVATCVGRNRLIQSVAANALRYDHDPNTGLAKGVLVEPSATNLLLWSEDISGSGWSNSNCTTSLNSATAPDGTSTADKLIEDTSTTAHVSQRSATTVSAATYTYSRWVKPSGRDYVLILFPSACFGAGVSVEFRLSTATVTSTAGGATGRITAWPGGWYRVEASAASTAAATGSFEWRMRATSGTSIYTGDGTSGQYLWGAQLEIGLQASSYIPTTSAAVTRNADDIEAASSAFPIDVTQGTLVAEWSIERQQAGSYIGVAALAGASSAERIFLSVDTSNRSYGAVVDDGVTQATVVATGTNPAAGAIRKACMSWRLNEIDMTADGTAFAQDASATLPTVTKLQIGRDGSIAGLHLGGHVRRVQMLTRTVTAAERAALALAA